MFQIAADWKVKFVRFSRFLSLKGNRMKNKKIIGEKREFCNGMIIVVNEELNDL